MKIIFEDGIHLEIQVPPPPLQYVVLMKGMIQFYDFFLQKQIQVCDTRTTSKTSSRKRRVADEYMDTQQYFQRETQFAVVEVSSAIVNEPPVIHNPIDVINIKEDEGILFIR